MHVAGLSRRVTHLYVSQWTCQSDTCINKLTENATAKITGQLISGKQK